MPDTVLNIRNTEMLKSQFFTPRSYTSKRLTEEPVGIKSRMKKIESSSNGSPGILKRESHFQMWSTRNWVLKVERKTARQARQEWVGGRTTQGQKKASRHKHRTFREMSTILCWWLINQEARSSRGWKRSISSPPHVNMKKSFIFITFIISDRWYEE